MTLQLWFAFMLAAGVLLIVPGPTNLMVMGYGLRYGTKPALSTVFGVVPGITTSMVLSFVGLGAVLTVSSRFFHVMKWGGAVYLVYLGIMQWRSSPEIGQINISDQPVSGHAIFLQSFTVTLLNPKGIIFFIAFMPQFISSDSPLIPQMLILGVTFLAMVFPVNTIYALLSGKMREMIQNRRMLRTVNRMGGAMMIGAGLLTVAIRRD